MHNPRILPRGMPIRRPGAQSRALMAASCDFADAINRHLERIIAPIEQDLDNLAYKFEFAVNPDNAAALVRFYVFDAIADTKFHGRHLAK
jgi:hypothetical protein